VTRGGSFIKPLGSDSNTQDGFDPSYGIIDEYHAHPTAGMLNVLESGMGARRSPLIDVITTAGYNKEFPCYTDLRRTSIEILKGIKQDETHLALIYELDKDDDWRDEATWIKSNPNLGVSVKPDFLRDRFLKAKNEGGSKEVDFKTKNLNIWTDSSHTWIPDDVWQACDGGGLPDLAGRECYGGLDLASVSDWNALVLVFPDDDRVHVKPFYWIPKGKIQKNPERIDYAKMIASGNVFVMEGDAADHALIARDVMEICHTYDVKGIAFDRYLVYSALIQYLKDVALPLHEFGQGFISMSAPTKELERMAYQGRLNHAGDPVLRWMNANVVIRTDPAGNIKIDKDKSTEKVDGMVALAMAIGEMMSHPEKGSIYNNDDFEFLEI
jgi:phage terminase large subunit-like protein